MSRARTLVLMLGAGAASAAGIASVRHRRAAMGNRMPGGILIGNAPAYDMLSRHLLRSLHGPIAADVAAVAGDGARVLEIGCGPGHLSMRLARQYGLDVTGLDLDPAMIERAQANAHRTRDADEGRPTFSVGDVASLSFPDGSFDLVVSTLSMHHWADAVAGVAEIGRVLRSQGRALIWDLRPGFPFHTHVPDPATYGDGAPLRLVGLTSWRWPWRLELIQRMELVHADSLTPSATDRTS